jgi:hypothetical protein
VPNVFSYKKKEQKKSQKIPGKFQKIPENSRKFLKKNPGNILEKNPEVNLPDKVSCAGR